MKCFILCRHFGIIVISYKTSSYWIDRKWNDLKSSSRFDSKVWVVGVNVSLNTRAVTVESCLTTNIIFLLYWMYDYSKWYRLLKGYHIKKNRYTCWQFHFALKWDLKWKFTRMCANCTYKCMCTYAYRYTYRCDSEQEEWTHHEIQTMNNFGISLCYYVIPDAETGSRKTKMWYCQRN